MIAMYLISRSLANKLFLTYFDMVDALIHNYVSVRNGGWNANIDCLALLQVDILMLEGTKLMIKFYTAI